MEYAAAEASKGAKWESVWNGIKPKKHQCQSKTKLLSSLFFYI